MTFWILTVALALGISAILALVLVRARSDEDGAGEPAAAYDLQVYRDQLRDIDRDLERGVIAPADAERVRVEVSRRILAADARVRQAKDGRDQPRALSQGMAIVLAVVLVGGSVGIYRMMGAPGYDDLALGQRIELAEQARKDRPTQQQAEAQMPPALPPELDPGYAKLIEDLRTKVAGRPDDLQGQVLLAQHEAKSGNFTAAHQAQSQVIALLGETVGAREYGEYGELLIVAAGGYVSPEAEVALRAALERDPGHGPSRYYWGLMLGQVGRPDMAFRMWEQTLRQGPPDAPWLVPIRGMIEEMSWRAGVDYTLPSAPPLAGPSAQDMQAASSMSAQDQKQMIRGMVERLSERLATEGGSPAEWARLIGALGVLGDPDRANAILNEAHTVFADNTAALDLVNQAARKAGLIQ